ncbi:MAG: shikimate dehydrogenase [Planctomycetes bacterium]|nr:shikimate dehydrogenase [Planctomycetota bacterium]
MDITARTQLCAVIGDPVGHSLSPQIHNTAFRACGLDYVYAALHVRRGDTGRAMQGVRSLGIRGLSVTIPHKLDVIEHLDAVDPGARAVGSVNTVVNEGGSLCGCSTDGPGALRALAAGGVDAAGRSVLMLGSGGAARAVAFALSALDPPPRLSLLGIVEDELRRLAADIEERTPLSVEARRLGDETLREAMAGAEILIHATPVGMTPRTGESLVDPAWIRPDQAVFDVVYTPQETKLLRDAKGRGARTVPGLGMFVHQAAIQFELWTGRDAPLRVMEQAVLEALGEAR